MRTTTNTKDVSVGMHPKWELTVWYMKRSARLMTRKAVVERTTRPEEPAGSREILIKVRTVKLGTR
jgi:hypothetical protein